MTQHQRDTYIDGREIMDRTIRYLTQIRDILDEVRQREHAERVKLLLNSVEVEQRELLGAFERYLADVPPKVLVTYSQYTVELPTDLEPPEEPLTTLGLLQWLLEHNGRLLEMFTELSEKGEEGGAGEQHEVFGGMAQQLESHDRALSKEYQRFEDL